ncbi:hypothetical protein RRG08_059958 [Elysia crispata]|uniref:Uncharacterized protein n=1 Tax=Elysia crispata TaxID=231223 RepID=A0AAE0Y7R7_9GAST|nr:hypothetical protein RRG08_059958 [Elysia crispata]
MIVEKSAWYNDLKYGTFLQRLRILVLLLTLIMKILGVELVVIGVMVLLAIYVFEHEAGYFFRQVLVSSEATEEYLASWSKAWNLKSLNLDRCLSGVIQSLQIGFSVIAVTGLFCLILNLCKSRAVNYMCLIFILFAIVYESKEMKKFDNVLMPLQASAMIQMRKAIRKNQSTLNMDFLVAADFLMMTGNCCGVIGGADMDYFTHIQEIYYAPSSLSTPAPKSLEKQPVKSMCWLDSTYRRNKTGCYVQYFESSIKPFIRSMYGLAMLTQVTIFGLLVILGEIPPNRQDALKLLFLDRLPSLFPVD